MSLLDDLMQGRAETARALPCPLCEYIRAQEDEDTRRALEGAAAGTIGLKKLAAILRQHDTGIGRRTLERHRREEHKPL